MDLVKAAERVQRASEGRLAVLDLTERPDLSFGQAADVVIEHGDYRQWDEVRVTPKQQHDWSVETRTVVMTLLDIPLTVTVGFAEPQGYRYVNGELTRFRLENGGVVQAAPPHQP